MSPLSEIAALFKVPIFKEDGQLFILLWLEEVGPVSFVQEEGCVEIFVDIGNDLFRAKDIMEAVLPSGIDIVWPSESEL